MDSQRPGLGNDKEFTVAVVEVSIRHGTVRAIDVHAGSDLRARVATAGQCEKAIDEIGGFVRHRERIPSHRIGRRRGAVDRRIQQSRVVDGLESDRRDGRPDPVEPRAEITRLGRGERGAAVLLRVQSARGLLRRISPDGQCTRFGLGGMLVPEPRHVRPLCSRLPRDGPFDAHIQSPPLEMLIVTVAACPSSLNP